MCIGHKKEYTKMPFNLQFRSQFYKTVPPMFHYKYGLKIMHIITVLLLVIVPATL
jgi:hypothetical protein